MVLYSPSSMQITLWGNIHVASAILCKWDGVADILVFTFFLRVYALAEINWILYWMIPNPRTVHLSKVISLIGTLSPLPHTARPSWPCHCPPALCPGPNHNYYLPKHFTRWSALGKSALIYCIVLLSNLLSTIFTYHFHMDGIVRNIDKKFYLIW